MRRVESVTITAEGRDKGKVFVLTEMPASKAEKWAARALLAISRSGVELPDNVEGAGLAGLAVLGLRALGQLNWNELEPLLDEMFECVQFQPGPQITRALHETDVEEVTTRVQLRSEVFKLHTGFSLPDGLSPTTSKSPPATPPKNLSPSRTSRVSSQR